MNFASLSLEDLFRLGDVNVHNVGPDVILVDFLPTEAKRALETGSNSEGVRYRGEGSSILVAINRMKVFAKEKPC